MCHHNLLFLFARVRNTARYTFVIVIAVVIMGRMTPDSVMVIIFVITGFVIVWYVNASLVTFFLVVLNRRHRVYLQAKHVYVIFKVASCHHSVE